MALQLQFIGCGDAFGSGGRFNTCFHVTGQETDLLIDCGASSLIAMKKLGIDRNAIDAILITHFHADHFGGIPFFILDAQFFSRRERPLRVIGPPGLASWYERVMETAFPGSSRATRRFPLLLDEISPGATLTHGKARITAFPVGHGPPGGSFVAYRLAAEGRIIAYTGDTEWVPDLVPLAAEADLFIAEAYFRGKEVATHLSLSTIEAHLPELTARRMVLTHMSEEMLSHRDRHQYELAEDGLTLSL